MSLGTGSERLRKRMQDERSEACETERSDNFMTRLFILSSSLSCLLAAKVVLESQRKSKSIHSQLPRLSQDCV